MATTADPRSWIKRTELKGPSGLSFPSDLDGTVSNFFELKFVNYDRNANLQKSSESPNAATCFLPVPANLSDSTDLNYGEYNGFGGLDKLLENNTIGDAVAQLPEVARGAGEAMVKLGLAKVALEGVVGGVERSLGVKGSTLGSRVSKIYGTQVGALINPALAVEFKGVQRKSYEFSWRMIARSQDESIMINKIVDCISWNILPEKVSGDWILTYPNIAFMKFHGNREYGSAEMPRQIIQFAPQGAVVTSMNVTYNGRSGQQVFFVDTGEPVEVALSLRLEDRGILTRELINTDWKS